MKRQLFAASALVLCGLAAMRLCRAPPAPLPSGTTAPRRRSRRRRKSGKPVLVDLYADWCGWCKTMEREVFTQPRFQTYAERFVLLRVDVEDGAAGSELQRRFRAESLPTLLLLDPKQSLLGKIEGFLETDRLIARLDGELAAYDAFLAAYDVALASSDPLLWRSRARELHARGDGGRVRRPLRTPGARRQAHRRRARLDTPAARRRLPHGRPLRRREEDRLGAAQRARRAARSRSRPKVPRGSSSASTCCWSSSPAASATAPAPPSPSPPSSAAIRAAPISPTRGAPTRP